MSNEIKKAPASTVEASAKDVRQLFHKDTISKLPRQQKRTISLLLTADRPLSVADIIQAIGQTDPRGHISRLRRRGYPIADIKCKSQDGDYYKRYFIRKEVQDGN